MNEACTKDALKPRLGSIEGANEATESWSDAHLHIRRRTPFASASTQSLPGLVNYALSATASLTRRAHDSLPMRRGASHSSLDVTTDNRHSFLEGRKLAAVKRPQHKGHRPRSYSEVPAIPSRIERAPPIATTNKTPIYEYYGFVMYLASFVAFDEHANVLRVDCPLVTEISPDWMPELHDIPISVVNAVLYQPRREEANTNQDKIPRHPGGKRGGKRDTESNKPMK
ncbi:hypothetical protein EC973_009440 [Apophysomyces ossiformis]|uniref:Uncharacterized protein n=1 Tax=Apophysomyces ossiformis TaxID=679940 RepID=A0A8H7BM06_9FUNG|nr:hypothetical protein EC973_009440 [Apophysomyces ossiformis]